MNIKLGILTVAIGLLGFVPGGKDISPKMLIGKWKSVTHDQSSIPTYMTFKTDSMNMGSNNRKYYVRYDTIYIKEAGSVKVMHVSKLTKDTLQVDLFGRVILLYVKVKQ